MVRIHNDQLSREIREAAKLQVGDDNPPSILANQVVPVIEVNPKTLKNGITRNIVKASTGASTVYTTPSNQDFYLCGLEFSFIKDAACDVATGQISFTGTTDGATRTFAVIPVITLTAQSEVVVNTFSHPIKIDRNTPLIIAADSFTAGVMIRAAIIWGFLDEQND